MQHLALSSTRTSHAHRMNGHSLNESSDEQWRPQLQPQSRPQLRSQLSQSRPQLRSQLSQSRPQLRPSIVNRPIQVSHEECNWQLWPVGGDGPKSIKLTLIKAEPSIWKQLLKKEEGGATGDADGNVRKKKD